MDELILRTVSWYLIVMIPDLCRLFYFEGEIFSASIKCDYYLNFGIKETI